jgi:hypothetical protein
MKSVKIHRIFSIEILGMPRLACGGQDDVKFAAKVSLVFRG